MRNWFNNIQCFACCIVLLATASLALGQTKPIALQDADLRVYLNNDTGLIEKIVSEKPTEKIVAGPIEIFCSLDNKEYLYNQVSTKKITEKNAEFVLSSGSPADSLFEVKIEYSWENSACFQEKVSWIAKKNYSKECKIGFRHKWNPDEWSTLVGGTHPVRNVPASQQTVFSFGKPIKDKNFTKLDQWQGSVFPLFVAMRDDRFLMAGDFCLDSFVTLSPNYPQKSFPSVQRNPTGIQKSEVLSLTINMRSFERSTHLLRDVWRWFMNQLYSNKPELNQYITKIPKTHEPLGTGNWCAFTYYQVSREQRMPSGAHIWWSMWHDQVREHYPISGSWFVNFPWEKGEMSAIRQKRELSNIIKMGHKPYLYFRNLVNIRAVKHGDIKKDWIKREESGDYDRYGTGRGLGWNMPPVVKKATGYDRVQWGFLDWSNFEARDWYLTSLKHCIRFYKPKGIALDFSWKSNEPEIQVIQGEIHQWLKQQYPDMKIAINEASGSPSQLLADVSLIENGYIAGKSWFDYEIAKAIPSTFVVLERFNLFQIAVENIVTGKPTWLGKEGIQDVKRVVDYLEKNAPGYKGSIDKLKNAAHLRAGMRDLALGAGWGYIEECSGHKLVSDFAGEINGLNLIGKSFAVQLPSGSDCDGDTYASAWTGDDKLRIALFNDSNKAASTTLKVRVDEKWAKSNNAKAFVVNSMTQKHAIDISKQYKSGMFEFKVDKLTPFSLLMISIDLPSSK